MTSLCAGSNSPLDVINYHVNAIKIILADLAVPLLFACNNKKDSFLTTWPKYDPRLEKTCLPVLRKPVFRFWENLSSGFATRWQSYLSSYKCGRGHRTLDYCLAVILSRRWTAQALTRLRGCADWSAPLLFIMQQRHIFSWRTFNIIKLCTRGSLRYGKPCSAC